MHRRHFLMAAGAGAAGALTPAWADLGGPLFVTAANRSDRSSWLVGLTEAGAIRFALALPGRGHGAATHPERAQSVVFARRPGNFALVLDCATGERLVQLETPAGLHFYGHGAFSTDGRILLTTENAYDLPDGRIGVWDAGNGYRRLGDFASGGLGPHEILRLADGSFAVANGGIQTHPDFARAKLNLPDMQTGLAILSQDGEISVNMPLAGAMRQNSVRHVAVDSRGRIVAALQWQGEPSRKVALAARFEPGQAPVLLPHPDAARLKNYAGSIAVSPSGEEIAVTGPKGGHVLLFDAGGRARGGFALRAASGVAPLPDGLAITFAGGLALRRGGSLERIPVAGGWSWDNHLVRVG